MSDPRMPSIWEPVAALVVLGGLLAVILWRNGHVLFRIAIIALCLGLAGCKSPGAPLRFSVLDLDFRTPEQIQACQAADMAPFQESSAPATVGEAKALPLTWWQALFAMVSDLECRIRFVTIERGRVEVSK